MNPYIWASILLLANAAWLMLTVLGLPGNWLILASTVLVAWLNSGDAMFSPWTLVAMTALTVVGEVLEFVAGMAGAQRAGASRRGTWGALLGGLAGGLLATFLIPIPVVGSLVGACLGAAAGAWAIELAGGRDMTASVRSGVGSGVGTLLGRIAKIGVGAALCVIAAVAAFWP